MSKTTDAWGRPYPLNWILSAVGKGWGKIVQRLIRDLFLLGWDGELHQIKEKFGGLRFYIGGGSDEIYNRIDAAEIESLRTCEWCGEKADTENSTGVGWILTLCLPCKLKRVVEERDRFAKECSDLRIKMREMLREMQ